MATDDDNEGETVTVGVELCAMAEERIGVMLHWEYSVKSKPRQDGSYHNISHKNY